MLTFGYSDLQARTFMNDGMIKLTIKNINRLADLIKRKAYDQLVREIRVISKYCRNFSRATSEYVIKEGFDHDRTPMNIVYKNGSDTLRAFIDTEDMYIEMKHYVEQELKCSIFW